MAKGKIKREPLGVDEVEIIHPYNDALQAIDKRIADAVMVYDHVVRKMRPNATHAIHTETGKPNKAHAESEKWLKSISDRIKSMEQSRKYLWTIGINQIEQLKTDENVRI